MSTTAIATRTGAARRWRFRQRLLAPLREWRRRDLERWELACLSERELRDFRVSRGEAFAEIRKPFWRA